MGQLEGDPGNRQDPESRNINIDQIITDMAIRRRELGLGPTGQPFVDMRKPKTPDISPDSHK